VAELDMAFVRRLGMKCGGEATTTDYTISGRWPTNPAVINKFGHVRGLVRQLP
jgi:hypothetical protein